MKRFALTFAVVWLATTVVGRWYAYHQLLADRRVELAARDAMEAALSQKIRTDDFAGRDLRLAVLLVRLAEQSPVPMKINRSEVEKTWLVMEKKIHIQPGLFTLEDLLDQITGQCDLGWCCWDDSVVVTSLAQADRLNAPFTRIYRLPSDLPSGAPLHSDDGDEFTALISTTIEPDTWDDVGGPGVLRDAQGAIVVHHSRQIHRQIAALLANLERADERGEKSFPLPPWPAEEELPVWAALDRIDSVDFLDVPLDQVARTLSQRHEITIVLATATLADAAIRTNTPVTIKLDNVSLRTILREILAELKLTYYVRSGGVIQITTPEDAEAQLTHWVHDVGDLLGQHDQHGTGRFEPLIDLITTTVEPDSWDEVGGPGCICPFGHQRLIVSQTQDIHEQVEQLLSSIRAVLSPAGARQMWLTPPEPMAVAIQRALDRPVTLSYRDVPLKDVCDQLTELLGVPLLMRKTLLEDAAVAEDTPITIDLPPLPLRYALALLLSDLNLALEIGSEVLYVTTAEDAESSVEIRLLDVRHLTSPGAGGIDERSLERLIRTEIRPDTWEEAGGPGWMSYYRGLLGVTQTVEIQQEVRHLIDVLSEHLLEPPSKDSPESLWLGRSNGEVQMLSRLQERDSLEVTNADIHETVQELCARHSIPLVFRQSYLERAVGGPRTATLSLTDAPLHEILGKLLAEKGGGIATWNGVLFVTDEEAAEGALRARLYPVGPRWPAEKKFSGKELARVLRDRVDPDSWWDKAGGPGHSMPLNGEWLLVAQTLDVHRQIEEAIEKLKAGEELPMRPDDAPAAGRQAIAPASE